MKTAATLAAMHVLQQTVTIFELSQAIKTTHLRTKFHEDWTINVTHRVLTRFYYSHISHVLKQI